MPAEKCSEREYVFIKDTDVIDCYQKIVKVNPEDTSAWNKMGAAYNELGILDKALECYKRTVESDSGNADTWFKMGNTHYKLGEYKKAIDCYQEAL
jgi:superkiller protein 3